MSTLHLITKQADYRGILSSAGIVQGNVKMAAVAPAGFFSNLYAKATGGLVQGAQYMGKNAPGLMKNLSRGGAPMASTLAGAGAGAIAGGENNRIMGALGGAAAGRLGANMFQRMGTNVARQGTGVMKDINKMQGGVARPASSTALVPAGGTAPTNTLPFSTDFMKNYAWGARGMAPIAGGVGVGLGAGAAANMLGS